MARQELLDFVIPDPAAFPLAKALEAACMRHDPIGAGVVTEANKHIVVAGKNPPALYKPKIKIFLRKLLIRI